MILFRLIFLTTLGVSLSTWLSFPVVVLISVAIFFIGTVNGFIIDSFQYMGIGFGVLYVLVVGPLLWLFPRFDGIYNPTEYLVTSRLLSWMLVGKVFLVMVAVKSMILSLAGIYFFSNRKNNSI